MNTNRKNVPTEFGPDTRFEVKPAPPAPFRELHENQFEQLKARLLGQRLEALWEPELGTQVRRAANEAAAIAWITPYPMLVFPALFEEKAETALRVVERQEYVARRSRALFTA